MVGGNEYDEKASAELMIRWTQLNTLLPSMQFSLASWEYGEECNTICRRYADLHTEFAPEIIRLARHLAHTGEPIIRPVFWLDETDEQALTCDDEFLPGKEYPVAPVVEPGARARDMYLPSGTWLDTRTGQESKGPERLKKVAAPMDRLPLFKCIG